MLGICDVANVNCSNMQVSLCRSISLSLEERILRRSKESLVPMLM